MAKKKTEVVENIVNEVEVSVNEQDNVSVDTQEVIKELPKIILEEFEEKVKFKNYISISDKNEIINLVWNNCIVKDEENNIYYIDSVMQDVAFHLAVLRYYTDFYSIYEYAEEYSYDELAEAGIFKEIEHTNYDIYSISDIIYFDFARRVNAMNSTGASLYRLLGGLLDKMPDANEISKTIKELPEVLNKVDPKVIEMFGKDLKNGTV